MFKRINRLLRDRLIIGGILLIMQILLMVVLVTQVNSRWPVIYHSLTIISVVVIIWMVRKYDNPAYKIAWIIVILAFPGLGVVLYLLWGNTPFNRARATHKLDILSPDFSDSEVLPVTELLGKKMPRHARAARYISRIVGTPVFAGTETEYFKCGEEQFASMLIELQKAKRFIFMEYFIIEEGEMWNPIRDILIQKVKEGLDVRVMYDDAGSISKLPHKYDKMLEALGIRCVCFNRFIPTINTYLNYRDHRKICVIDGNVGYTGGINLADEYINVRSRFGYWKDTGVLLRGEGVANMTEMFLQMWEYATGVREKNHKMFLPTERVPAEGFVQSYGDSPLDGFNVGEAVYMRVLNTASNYVYITTPYLILDNEMITALTLAAQAGVDVRIVTPGIPDKKAIYAVTRSYYTQLIRAGVKIYEYTPGFVHAKMIVSDDDIAVVGTINMDFRSFFMHFECATALYGTDTVEAVREDIEEIIAQSELVDKVWFKKISWVTSIAASVLRLFAPLL